jgi:purine-binding chemotaxis protein CheW
MFDIVGERYGLAIENVSEIFRPRGITPVPGVGENIAGVTNLRGEIVTVLNLAGILGVRNSDEQPAEEQILVAEDESGRAGLLVDGIAGIVDIAIDAVDPPLNTLEKVRAEHLLGEFKIDDRLVGLLNPANILRT